MAENPIDQIESVIAKAKPEQQRRFLALLKLAEGSFEFWDNPDAAVYNQL